MGGEGQGKGAATQSGVFRSPYCFLFCGCGSLKEPPDMGIVSAVGPAPLPRASSAEAAKRAGLPSARQPFLRSLNFSLRKMVTKEQRLGKVSPALHGR